MEQYPEQIDLTKVSKTKVDRWMELLQDAALNASQINPYWYQFDPIGQVNGGLFGAFMILLSIGSLIGNFMIAIHSLK